MGSIGVEWLLYRVPLPVLSLLAFATLVLACLAGERLRRRRHPDKNTDDESAYDGYIVSGVLGLLALLLGFTFSLAVDRYDARRAMIIQESNAIGTAYLRAQTFPEPHRTELSHLLARYADVRLNLSQAVDLKRITQLLATSDALQADMWTASLSAIALQRDDVSSAYMESMNETIDAGAARKAARMAHVPSRIFVVLFTYMLITAGILGYVISSRRRIAVIVLLALVTMSYTLTVDIDSPNRGRVRENQQAMVDLKEFIATHPPAAFQPAPSR